MFCKFSFFFNNGHNTQNSHVPYCFIEICFTFKAEKHITCWSLPRLEKFQTKVFFMKYARSSDVCSYFAFKTKVSFSPETQSRFMAWPLPLVYPALLRNHFYLAVKNN